MQSSVRATPARPTSPPAADSIPRSIDFTLTFPARIGAAIYARAMARGIAPEAWIREWVTVGLAEESIGAEDLHTAASGASADAAAPALGDLDLSTLEDFNTAEKVALYLGVSRSSIYRLTETGLMGHVKIGSLVRIRRQDVEAFLSPNTHAPRKEAEGKNT